VAYGAAPGAAYEEIASMRIPEYRDEAREITNLLAVADRSSRVLDVGCGTGRNLELLRTLGFTRVRGVDRNRALVAQNRARGFDCVTVEDLESDSTQYDLLVMSHIIEHFDHEELLTFLESYLKRLRTGGRLLIVTPLPSQAFYNDFDHTRPYLPIGLKMVFGDDLAQVQFQSKDVLSLEDLRFYSDQFRLHFYRRLFLQHANPLPLWVNRVLKLLFVLSRGAIGRRVGWMGLYRYIGRREGQSA
jgi:SAM-dependent methyltransferase